MYDDEEERRKTVPEAARDAGAARVRESHWRVAPRRHHHGHRAARRLSLVSFLCSRTTSRCSEQTTPAAAAGSAAVVAVSFSLVLFLEGVRGDWKAGPSAGRAGEAPITGRLQFLIIYVLVPLVPGLVVGYLTLSPATRLSQASTECAGRQGSRWNARWARRSRTRRRIETRVAGLRALAQFGSPDALNELARLARSSPGLLNDPPSFDALASALALFGVQSEPLLQAIWKESGRAGAGSTPWAGEDAGGPGADGI